MTASIYPQKKLLAFTLMMKENITLEEADERIEKALQEFVEEAKIECAGYMIASNPKESAYEIKIDNALPHKIVQWLPLKERSSAKRIDSPKVIEWLNTPEGRLWVLETPDFHVSRKRALHQK